MKYTSIFLTLLLAGKTSATVTTGLLTFSNNGIGQLPGTWSITTPIELASVSWGFDAVSPDTYAFNTSLVADTFRAYQVPNFSSFGINNIPTSGLIANNLGEPVVSFDIPDGGSTFIALDISPENPIEFRHFAWIEIENNGGILTSTNNASTTMSEPGLIIGTTTAIPEPSTSILTSLFLATLFLRRSR